jgi:mRNA interferase MazF
MTTYNKGDILLVRFPFTTGASGKNRPALVVLDSGDSDVSVARITTQRHGSASDISVVDWRAAGLLAPSQARLEKLVTLEKSLVQRTLGTLQTADKQAVGTALQKLFSGW